MDFPGGSVVKNPPANLGDASLIPGLGRSLEKEMATHCSILVWRIPWTEKPGGLWGHKRVGYDLGTKQQQQLRKNRDNRKPCESCFTSSPS